MNEQGLDADEFNVRDLREGDPAVFRKIFFQYYPDLFAFAGFILPDESVARNITKESLFILWKKRLDFDNLKDIKAFLYITVRNSSVDYLRYIQQHPSNTEYIGDENNVASLPDGTLLELTDFVESYHRQH